MAEDLISPKSIEAIIPMVARPDDEVPLSELERRLDGMKRFNSWDVDNDCRRFADTMTLWKEKRLYEHFSSSWESFVDEHVQKPIEWVNHVIQGVPLLDPNAAISPKDAIAAFRKQAAIQAAEQADPTLERKPDIIRPGEVKNPHGKNQYSEKEDDRSHDYGHPQERGSEYLAQRIAESSPEIHESLKRGEYPSVRSAAIAAGVLKPRQTFSVGETTTPEAFAGALFERLEPDFLALVVAILTDAMTTG